MRPLAAIILTGLVLLALAAGGAVGSCLRAAPAACEASCCGDSGACCCCGDDSPASADTSDTLSDAQAAADNHPAPSCTADSTPRPGPSCLCGRPAPVGPNAVVMLPTLILTPSPTLPTGLLPPLDAAPRFASLDRTPAPSRDGVRLQARLGHWRI
jgi:hypothetical protein